MMWPVAGRVFVSADGNVFMREIAEHLAEALVATGRATAVVTAELPGPADDPLDNLVVAPHEFFGLFDAPAADVEAAAAHAVAVNTEQPGTPFFELAMGFSRRGPLVFDINPFSLASVRRLGMPAVHLPLGYVPSMDHWRRRARQLDTGRAGARTVDVAMLAGRTPRREAFLGGAASVLWEWRTDLRMFSWHRPVRGDAATFLAGAAKYDALARMRILLNVHRSDDPYFEWARVIEAIANGCVVVTEPSTGTAPLVAGEHFVEAPLEYLAEQAVALAFDEARRARIADAAYELLTSELDQAALLDAAFTHAATLVAPHGEVRRRHVPAGGGSTVSTRRVGVAVTSLKRALRRSSVARDAETEQLRTTAGRLKRAYLQQVVHTRAIERALCTAVDGDPDPVSTLRTPSWHAFEARVAVVVPLFNQGHYLRDAVCSVVGAASGSAAATELIIVDDHSTDDSAARAEQLLEELPWFPITLLRRHANGGLPVARNTGFASTTAPYLFALDADNVLYPCGLRLLVDHLEQAPDEVIAAYGMLERFDDSGAVGLTSHLPWDVDLLVHGAYIDAMAMFRRDRWTELGGYADSVDVYGWEDYDLWLSAAERGLRADLVAQFVGRYREQAGSMRKISDIDMATTFVALRDRHPRLPWPS